MSPAFKQVIYTVTGAGLLLASIMCTADDGISSTANSVSSIISTAPAESITQQQIPPISTTHNTEASKTGLAVSQVEASIPLRPANETQVSPQAVLPNGAVIKNTNTPQIGSGGHLLNVTLGLLLIIGLIFGLSWFVKRFSNGTFTGNSHLKIIAAMPLGTRERIVLIDAGGQQLLLGITPTHINTLHTFDNPVATNQVDAGTSDFSRKLMAILQRPNNTADDSNHNNNSGSRE